MKLDKSKFDLAMAKNCFSAERLSEITGVSSVTIARIKNGSQQPRPQTIGKIAKALNVEVETIIQN